MSAENAKIKPTQSKTVAYTMQCFVLIQVLMSFSFSDIGTFYPVSFIVSRCALPVSMPDRAVAVEPVR